MYPRTVKVRSSSGTVNQYVRIVEAYREGGKVKQRVVADLGRKDLLAEILPKLQRLLTGDTGADSASGPSSTRTSGTPKASRSPTAPSCSSPTGSSPPPVSTGSPAGSRPTS